ncbi:MAG: hypothetical protein VST64_02260 [Nitrospirota bacterium]|nr:hypothetical protein [Nitrospirota bacterium]
MKQLPRDSQPLLVGMALGLMIGVLAVDLVIPIGPVPGVLYVSLAMLSVASSTTRLPFLATIAFTCLIAYYLDSTFTTFHEISSPVLAQTSLLLVAIWVPVGVSLAMKRAEGLIALSNTRLHLCPSCKKIRDEKGVWNTIDDFVREKMGRETSTAVCADCRKRWTEGQSHQYQ